MGRNGSGRDSGEVSLQDFKYVDAFHLNPGTNKRTKWTRLEAGEPVEEFRNKHNNYNVFMTVQRYRNKTRKESGGELMYAPLFFDIDSSRTLVQQPKKPEPGLFELKVFGNTTAELEAYLPKEHIASLGNYLMGIPLDENMREAINTQVDSNPKLKDFLWHKNLELSRMDVVKIITFFTERFGITEDEIRVYFSGSKGFHILLDPIVLGIEPDRDLHRYFKFIALYLESQLKLGSLDAGSIYGTGRMLRLVNSVHHKSGLFKVELTHTELKGDLQEVVDVLAKSPRPDIYPPEIQELSLNVDLNAWYLEKVKQWEEAQKLADGKTAPKDEALSSMEGTPPCVEFILQNGVLKSGDRNKATMALASYYKAIGYTLETTIATLTPWAARIPRGMTSSAPSEVEASTASCIKTVYNESKYHFACAYIRSLHGEKSGREYESIPCGGRDCAAHEDHAIDQEPAEFMHLAHTAKAEYTNKKVAFNALVSGKLDTPYIVPKLVRFVCHHLKHCQKPCIMDDYEGMYEREFHENDRFLIEATNQNDNNLKGILRHHSGASCNKVSTEILEYVNVSELLVVPMADRIKSVKGADGEIKDVDESGNEYVTRKMYAVGTEIQSNQHYKIEGYVYSHPKNAMATVLSQAQEPMQDSVAQFTLTDETKERLGVFQVQQGETLDDRVSLIIEDLVENVTLVRERFEAHLAVLLTYHSCLNYYFQDTLEKRGWIETVMVGDSGQAKSMLVNNLMEFCGLGSMTSGEGASRTGLVYRLEQLGERWFITWGKYPLSDRKLLAIDEFSELNPEDFGKITEARTNGVLRVDRTVNTETNARVRLLMLTNPVGTNTLKNYTHGVEALKRLFATPADIRRLDMAVFLMSGDTSNSVLNTEYEKPAKQIVTSEALKESILWAWSRKPEQIKITPPAMKMILKQAGELAEKYGYAQDIPLMEPADLRKKIARMAIALAAFVHSTDETHEKIIVEAEHVEYAIEFLQVVYDNKNCRLDIYSAKSREESELTEDERELIKKTLDDLDFGDNQPVSAEVIELFRKNDVLKPQEIMDMLGYDRGQVNSRLSVLNHHSMIKRTREGIRKLPKFIEYMNL